MDTPARSSTSSIPAARTFQVDASATGNAQDSVNLFRGDVSIPLQLVSLPGPNGMDLNVSANYSGALGEQPDLDNLAAPTGVLGLGWSIGFDAIEFQSNGTTSLQQGRFIARASGAAVELVLLEWKNRGQANEQLTFANPGEPLWQYRYSPADEAWEVLRDDGVTMRYGGRSSRPDAVQWGVRWGDWAGGSNSASGSPQRYGLAWNLAEVVNQWGNTIRYYYAPDEHTVVGDLTYTRASYVERIEDAYGNTVSFDYAEKDRVEYQPPHTIDDRAPDRAWQDRYETKFLQRLSVQSSGGALLYTLEFDSEPLEFGPEGKRSSPLGKTAKRYLLGIRQARNGHDVLPPTVFGYDWVQGSPSRGRMLTQTYPSGGLVTWSYREISLGESEVFNLDYNARRPAAAAYKDAEPRLWFGDDYVVIAWYAKSFSQLLLEIYQYGGRWSQSPYRLELGGVALASAADVRVAFGQDFLTMHFHNLGAATDTLHVLQKIPYQFGRWQHLSYPGIRADDVLSVESTLVAGTDFIALHPGGVTGLTRISFDRRSRQWTPAPGSAPATINGPRNETRMALAASGDVLAVGFFSSGQTVSAVAQLYWLDRGAPGRPSWQQAFAFLPAMTMFGLSTMPSSCTCAS
jgi:large repetitive protein